MVPPAINKVLEGYLVVILIKMIRIAEAVD